MSNWKELIQHEMEEQGETFEDVVEWGEITFARTLLEQIGVEFEYPYFEEND